MRLERLKKKKEQSQPQHAAADVPKKNKTLVKYQNMLNIDLRELILINKLAKKYLSRMQEAHEKQYKTEEKR